MRMRGISPELGEQRNHCQQLETRPETRMSHAVTVTQTHSAQAGDLPVGKVNGPAIQDAQKVGLV